MRFFVFLCFLIGCAQQPQDEIDTFSAGDRAYILNLIQMDNKQQI